MKSAKEAYSSKSFGTAGDPVIFFFTAFKTKYWLYYPVIRNLTKAGYYVVVYDINADAILKGEPEDFLNLADHIVLDVQSQVENFKQAGVKKFSTFGVSMGTLFALRISVDIPDIKKVVANLTYGSFADNVWSWKPASKLKRRLEGAGINKAALENLLTPISPLSMAPKLKGKKLLLYLAKNDKVILFSQSSQFKEALDRAGINYIYHQNNKFGHLISGVINNSRPKIYLDFLKDD